MSDKLTPEARWERVHFYSLSFVMPGCGNNRSHSHACCSSQETLSKCSPTCQPQPLEAVTWSQNVWLLLCLTSWLPIHPSSRWSSESSPSPRHRECCPCHLEQHFCCSKPKWIWREAGSWSWGETFPDSALWPWLLPVQCLLGKLNTSWSSVPFPPPQSQGWPAIYPVDQHILKWCIFPPADFHVSFHRGAPSMTGTSHHRPGPNPVPSEPRNLFFPHVEGSDTALSSLSLWIVT